MKVLNDELLYIQKVRGHSLCDILYKLFSAQSSGILCGHISQLVSVHMHILP